VFAAAAAPAVATIASPGACAASWRAWSPTNPVVVKRAGARPFILATVPKAGCTNLRKLLRILISFYPAERDPRPGRRVPLKMRVVHNTYYPTVWHYDATSFETRARGELPTFIVSRNPYVRLLSGFLDKLVAAPGRPPWTMQVRACVL
jgi:hypothetical protein